MRNAEEVKKHYTGPALAQRLKALLPAVVDELHIGGRPATDHLLGALNLQKGMTVLDAGCGLGGAARRAQAQYGAAVKGVDFSADYIACARALNEKNGPEFIEADVLALPFTGNSFHAAYTIHAGMNIADKPAFYREIFRVLRPGARFGLYDILAGGAGAPVFPLPWAESARTSFLCTIGTLESDLTQAGFDVLTRENRADFARAALARAEEAPAAPVVIGPNWRERIANLRQVIENGACVPWQVIAEKRG